MMCTKIITYNKLVRDRIPEIIERSGKCCKIQILCDEEYLRMIDAKLDEELADDLLEVIYAAAEARGYSIEHLEKVRLEKVEKSGGFQKRLLLTEVIE